MIFLKILSLDRGRDGDENFFLQIFFSSPSRPRSRPQSQNFALFFEISGAGAYIEKREKLEMCEIPRIVKK
jgi:hypothetical protein